MKILIDANVALDVLLERPEYYISGTKILGLSQGGVELFISSTTITDIYYIVRRQLKSKDEAIALLKKLLSCVNIAAVTGAEIRRAIDLEWIDFEDAVQYVAGESIPVNFIVTRNIADYAHATIQPQYQREKMLRKENQLKM